MKGNKVRPHSPFPALASRQLKLIGLSSRAPHTHRSLVLPTPTAAWIESEATEGLSPPPACPLSSQGYQCIDWQRQAISMGGVLQNGGWAQDPASLSSYISRLRTDRQYGADTQSWT